MDSILRNQLYFSSVILIILLAILDRMREATSFWFDISIFKDMNPKVRDWFDSSDDMEKRTIKIFGVTIKLHPIFWDGYHFSKNMSILLIALFFAINVHWSLVIFLPLLWYVFEYLAYRWFIKDEYEDYDG